MEATDFLLPILKYSLVLVTVATTSDIFEKGDVEKFC